MNCCLVISFELYSFDSKLNASLPAKDSSKKNAFVVSLTWLANTGSDAQVTGLRGDVKYRDNLNDSLAMCDQNAMLSPHVRSYCPP